MNKEYLLQSNFILLLIILINTGPWRRHLQMCVHYDSAISCPYLCACLRPSVNVYVRYVCLICFRPLNMVGCTFGRKKSLSLQTRFVKDFLCYPFIQVNKKKKTETKRFISFENPNEIIEYSLISCVNIYPYNDKRLQIVQDIHMILVYTLKIVYFETIFYSIQ